MDTNALIDHYDQTTDFDRGLLDAVIGPAIDAIYEARDSGKVMHEAGAAAAVAVLRALEARLSTGADMIAAERLRQVTEEGYTPEHDDEHGDGSLAIAAACYAMPGRLYVERRLAGVVQFQDPWPWEYSADRRKRGSNYPNNIPTEGPDRMRMLVKAGALIAAEIERHLRDDGSWHYLCCNCGGVAPAVEFEAFVRDDEGEHWIPAPDGSSDPMLRCPLCKHEHVDDDSNPGLYDGTRTQMLRQRAEIEPEYAEWWAEAA